MADYQEFDIKVVSVYGDAQAKEKNLIPAYQRTLRTRPIVFTCAICGKEVTQERFPSPRPHYCSEACETEGIRIKTRQRARRRREKKRVLQLTEKSQEV